MSLQEAAERVAAEFEYTDEQINKAVELFLKQMDEGLQKTGATMQQIPTYVTGVPNGSEKGLYMAVDLGGTNFRVCSIQLHGDSTFSLTQSKVAIPKELMVAKTYKELFSFLAKQIESFLVQHHGEHYKGHMERRRSSAGMMYTAEVFSLGFTFSFPVQQSAINRGTLVRWTKGFDVKDAVGKDVCLMLQDEIDELQLPVRVVALVNDTVGTLMARAYTSPGKAATILGAIFGTGTNGAYVEKLDRITKLTTEGKGGDYDTSTGEMIVNTEWGSFDDAEMAVLPKTPYDDAVDRATVNPGLAMFEKRVSGMFLGEILRRAILSLVHDPNVPLFQDSSSGANDLHSTTSIAPNSSLYNTWGLDTSFLSIAHGDQSEKYSLTRLALSRALQVSASSFEDAAAVKKIASAIGRRAARLSAVGIASVIIAHGKLDKPAKSKATITEAISDATGTIVDATANALGSAHPSENASDAIKPAAPRENHDYDDEDVVDVGVDGSLVEFYPGFEQYIRETLRAVPKIGPEGEKRVRIGIAKDGSGVGAALIALVAEKMAQAHK